MGEIAEKSFPNVRHALPGSATPDDGLSRSCGHATFDSDLFIGLVGLVLTFFAALGVAFLTGANPALTAGVFGFSACGLLVILERQAAAMASHDPAAIRIAWADKLSDTDFAATGDMTKRDLETLGVSSDDVIGQQLVFAAEQDGAGGAIMFAGSFVQDGDRLVIRATKPVALQTISTSSI